MRYLLYLIFILSTNNSFSQVDTFNTLNSKIFFNIPINDPDSSILEFCRRYFPSYTRGDVKFEIRPVENEPESIIRTIHSLSFREHPLVNNFLNGKLMLGCVESKNYLPRINAFRLSFEFRTAKELNTALDKLDKLYTLNFVRKKSHKSGSYIITRYTDTDKEWNYLEVQVRKKTASFKKNELNIYLGCTDEDY